MTFKVQGNCQIVGSAALSVMSLREMENFRIRWGEECTKLSLLSAEMGVELNGYAINRNG